MFAVEEHVTVKATCGVYQRMVTVFRLGVGLTIASFDAVGVPLCT
ncbi:MAG TPA: hypothetical protein VN035_13450 [Microbacterium sp.]|nr:hypothetical protein [Microbacterium sp.]